MDNFRSSTRQKADNLYSLNNDDLGNIVAGIFTSEERRVAGYSGLSWLIVSDRAFTARVEEAISKLIERAVSPTGRSRKTNLCRFF